MTQLFHDLFKSKRRFVVKKQNLKFKTIFLTTLISLIFVQCGNYKQKLKEDVSSLFGQPTAKTLLLKKLMEEKLNKVKIDFSGLNENLHDVLRYRTKTTKTKSNPLLPLLNYKEEEVSNWKEIPSKKIDITKNSYIEISLKDSIVLGKEKITSDTKIKIKDIMGSDKKIKNFKYLVLSLSSKKNAKISISKDNLKELKDKKIDLDQSYINFKKDEKVKKILADKVTATDSQVENFKIDN